MNDGSVPAQARESESDIPLFQLGEIVATPDALALLQRNGVNAATLLRRHQCGDWGELSVRDRTANDRAIKDGSRILSAYMVAGKKVWVVTDAASDDSISRTSTCVLMAGEY